jgi:hypothetical protein
VILYINLTKFADPVKVNHLQTSVHLALAQATFLTSKDFCVTNCISHLDFAWMLSTVDRQSQNANRISALSYNIGSLVMQKQLHTEALPLLQKAFDLTVTSFGGHCDQRGLELVTSRCKSLCKCLVALGQLNVQLS